MPNFCHKNESQSRAPHLQTCLTLLQLEDVPPGHSRCQTGRGHRDPEPEQGFRTWVSRHLQLCCLCSHIPGFANSDFVWLVLVLSCSPCPPLRKSETRSHTRVSSREELGTDSGTCQSIRLAELGSWGPGRRCDPKASGPTCSPAPGGTELCLHHPAPTPNTHKAETPSRK